MSKGEYKKQIDELNSRIHDSVTLNKAFLLRDSIIDDNNLSDDDKTELNELLKTLIAEILDSMEKIRRSNLLDDTLKDNPDDTLKDNPDDTLKDNPDDTPSSSSPQQKTPKMK